MGTLLLSMTTAVNSFSLLVTFWLGFYLVTRSPRRLMAWLASATLWSLSGAFLNVLVYIHAPAGDGTLPWWWGWSTAIAVPFAFHLSVHLLPKHLADRQRWLMILMYFLTLNLLAMETYTQLVYLKSGIALPLRNNALSPGNLYPVFGAFLVLGPALALSNFLIGRRYQTSYLIRKQYAFLIIAIGLSILSAIYGVCSTGWRLPTPTWIGDLVLGLAAVPFALSIARLNAIAEGRVVEHDFTYAMFIAAFVVVVYSLVAFLLNLAFGIPFIVFVFIILLAIASHSMIDWARGCIERWISPRHRYRYLRAKLRDFSRRTRPEHDLQPRMEAILESLCQSLHIGGGLIALREGEQFHVVACWKWKVAEKILPAEILVRNEIISLKPSDHPSALRGASIVVPLIAGGEQRGSIMLAKRDPELPYSEEDHMLLEDFADTVASVVYGLQQQEQSIRQIEALVQEVEERDEKLRGKVREALEAEAIPSVFDGLKESEMISLVEEALRRLFDFSFLGQHPLADLQIAERYLDRNAHQTITHIDRGKALQELINSCIQKLRPSSPRPSLPGQEWYQYIVLNDCYVEGKRNREVMAELYVGEGTFNRARRRAVRALTRALAEMEREALASDVF
jgi:hypothetical protein